MAKKPITKQTPADLTIQGDPRKNRRFYLKQMFQKDLKEESMRKYWYRQK